MTTAATWIGCRALQIAGPLGAMSTGSTAAIATVGMLPLWLASNLAGRAAGLPVVAPPMMTWHQCYARLHSSCYGAAAKVTAPANPARCKLLRAPKSLPTTCEDDRLVVALPTKTRNQCQAR